MTGAYDRARLVELFGNDAATIAAVEQEFLETARDVAREIDETSDLDIIARAAHRLKGASGMIGAVPLHGLAQQMERAAKAQDLATVRRLREPFQHEVMRVAEQAGLPTEQG